MSGDPRIDELLDRWEEAQERGHPVSPEELCRDCPELLEELRWQIRELQWVAKILDTRAASQVANAVPFDVPKTLGRYRLDELIGQGGFGQVWKGYDPELDRQVAIKILRPERRGSVFQNTDFLGEAKKVAKLKHPNIVSVHDVGQDQGFCYMVSDLVTGFDLAKISRSRRLGVDEAVRIVAKVANALHHAHENGVIHRDIKPHNILLDKLREPFVTDFGIAVTEVEIESDAVHRVGTPAYMAPEQAEPNGPPIDRRCDIYSLGVVLYELLVGVAPYEGQTVAELRIAFRRNRPQQPTSLVADIPDKLDAVCMKALQLDPDQRWNTAQEFADALIEIMDPSLQQPSSEARPSDHGHAEEKPVGGRPRQARSRLAVMFIGAAVFGSVALAVAWAWHNRTIDSMPPAGSTGPGSTASSSNQPGQRPPSATTPPKAPPALPTARLLRTFQGSKNNVRCCQLSVDESHVIVVGMAEPVIIYNVNTGQDVCRLKHEARYAFFTEPDQVVTFGRYGEVCWWSFPEGELLSKVPFAGCLTTGDHSVVSNTVAYVDETYASVFDLAKRQDIWHIQGKSKAYCVAISNDGELVLTGEHSGYARLWSVSEQRELRLVEDSNNYIQACAISPDKSLALVGSWTNMAFLHNLVTGELVRSHRATVLPMSAAFSADGELYALGCEGMIHVWETATGKKTTSSPAHNGQYVEYLRFSSDGTKLLSGGRDSMGCLWELPPRNLHQKGKGILNE